MIEISLYHQNPIKILIIASDKLCWRHNNHIYGLMKNHQQYYPNKLLILITKTFTHNVFYFLVCIKHK